MKIHLRNTASGLIPLYDSDYEEKRKLKIGEDYVAEIRLARNLQFHRKYFALIKCAWEYQNESVQSFFHNDCNLFRKTVEVAAGICERVFNIQLKTWVDIPRSIAFSAMDEAEFTDMYEKIKDVLFSTFLKDIDYKEFQSNLINF